MNTIMKMEDLVGVIFVEKKLIIIVKKEKFLFVHINVKRY